jgi:hypothetical protein
MKTRPERDQQQTAQCIYSTPSECGRSYIGETGRPLARWRHEHRSSLKEGLLEKSKLAWHAYEEGHGVAWDEARILKIENNSRYRKYKKLAHVVCLTSSNISPIWIPLISNEVSNSQRRSVWCDRFFMGFCNVLVLSVQFLVNRWC